MVYALLTVAVGITVALAALLALVFWRGRGRDDGYVVSHRQMYDDDDSWR